MSELHVSSCVRGLRGSRQTCMTQRSLWLTVLLVVFSAVAAVDASQSTLQLRGSWRATVGTRVFQGTWTAVLDPKTPNLAQGSWTVIEANRVLFEGTWAAEKERAGWRGGWSALVAPARPGAPPMTGAWQAN